MKLKKLLTLALAAAALTGACLTAGAAESQQPTESIELKISEPGEVTKTGPTYKVEPNAAMALQLTYTGQNLGSSQNANYNTDSTALKVALVWLDAAGADLDVARANLGFPPLKQSWELADGSGKPVPVAINVSVPGEAFQARVDFALVREGKLQPGGVTIRDVRLEPGPVEEKGIEVVVTGPPDAGPLNEAPKGVAFGPNLVPNPTIEEGDQMPAGWRIVGDNSGGAARWIDGGAYSGKRALRIDDRGPYRRSWGEEPDPEVLIPGGEPNSDYLIGREEVYARWVSDPAPAAPGAMYQTLSVLFVGNRKGSVLTNPVRIEFLDANGKPLPWAHKWEHLMPGATEGASLAPGWTPVVGNPAIAPANAKQVRVVVALQNAVCTYVWGRPTLSKVAANTSFVVVDNIALYKVATPLPAGSPELKKITLDQAFTDTVAASGVPFVPSSPAHRPNSLSAESDTPIGAGILLRGQADKLGLVVRDRIGDRRELTVAFRLLDYQGEPVHQGEVRGTVEPYREAVIPLGVAADLPLGPYTVDYQLLENGKTAHAGETRLAVTVEHPADAAERRRMDYPFATWSYRFKLLFQSGLTREFDWLGKICQYMGSGKQGFVVGFYQDHYLTIADDAARRARIQADIAAMRRLSEAMAKYDITTLPLLHPGNPLTDETRPRAIELATMLVNGFADLSLVWTYGDETMHGGITVEQMDETKRADGSKIMNWSYPGTARQFIADYVVTYDAMKAAQPDVIVGFNSACDPSGNVMRMLLAADAGGKFDMFGSNMFQTPFAIFPATLLVMKENGMNPDDIYLFGHNYDGIIRTDPAKTGPGPTRIAGELKDAIFQTKYWTQTLHGFPQLTYVPQWHPGMVNDGKSLEYNQRVTPAWSSYAAMTRFLGAGRFTAKHEFPGAEVYVRERSARPGLVGVAWATGKDPATVELAVGASTVRVADIWGNEREVAAPEGVLTLELTDSPQYILGAEKLAPAPSVRIALEPSGLRAGAPRVAVTLRNELTRPLAGTLTLAVRGAATVAPATIAVDELPAGGSRRLEADLALFDPTDDRPLPVVARFTAAGGRMWEATQPLDFHFAPRRATPPKIDGFLDDWTLPESLALVADREDQLTNFRDNAPWTGPESLSGQLWLQWDEKNLYLAAKVRDGREDVVPSPEWLWAGDSIEMNVCAEGGRAPDSRFAQIALGQVKDLGPRVMRYKGAGPNGLLPDAVVAARRMEGGYVYEAAIPWRDVSATPDFKPAAGRSITTVFGFNDKDAGTRLMSWFGRVNTFDPSRFGQVLLCDPLDGVAFPPAPKNLVANGGFDDPALPPADDLSNWRTTFLTDKQGNPSAKAYLSAEGALKGKGLVIERLHDQNHATVGGFRVPVEAGRRYLIRAMIKAPMRSPSLQTAFLDAANKAIKVEAPAVVLSPATDWHYDSFIMLHVSHVYDRERFHPAAAVVEAPAGAKALTIDFSYNWGTGKAHFDDVEVFELATPERTEGKE
jgi:hypothetical protein